MDKIIYTLGYTGSKLSLGELLAFCELRNLKLVDVRISPRSRAAQWNMAPMKDTLKDRYAHIREFGNKNYRNGDAIELVDPVAGMVQIKAILSDYAGVVLCCACSDHMTCHRSDVAHYVSSETGLLTIHLSANDIREALAQRG